MIAGSVGVGKGGSPPLTRTRDVLLSRRHALLRLDVSLQAIDLQWSDFGLVGRIPLWNQW